MSERLSDDEVSALYQAACARLGTPLFGWRHRATGRLYTVHGLYLREDDHEPMVAYSHCDRVQWCRPLEEFLTRFDRLEV